MTAPYVAGGTKALATVRVTRDARMPDDLRLARYRKTPEYGPHVLFFSGGTAINRLSRRLIDYTHNSIHLVTPFDSGGSSAELRAAFDVPGVGDFRSRLMSLADHSVRGQAEIFELLSYRLPRDAHPEDLHLRLQRMVYGDDPLVARISDPMRKLIRNHLNYVLDQMPEELDLRGASVGNLILVGGYLNNARDLEPVLFLFSKLVEVRGTVRPVVGESFHLAAQLQDGTIVMGQHLLTGKEVLPISSPVQEVYLVDRLQHARRVTAEADEETVRLIRRADLICFPMGSFYSSVVANLLPRRVGQAIRANGCPKVYIPNTGSDPEQLGLSLAGRVDTLIRYLRRDGRGEVATGELLNFVVIDNRDQRAATPEDLDHLARLGIGVIDVPLVTPRSDPDIDEDVLLEVLMSMT
jgi:CofD-related protein of GAK system